MLVRTIDSSESVRLLARHGREGLADGKNRDSDAEPIGVKAVRRVDQAQNFGHPPRFRNPVMQLSQPRCVCGREHVVANYGDDQVIIRTEVFARGLEIGPRLPFPLDEAERRDVEMHAPPQSEGEERAQRDNRRDDRARAPDDEFDDLIHC